MKKILAIGVAAMLVLVVALAAYGQNNSTEVTFEVSDSYVLYIPPTATIGNNGIGTMSIYLMEGRVDSVDISLNTNDNFGNTWQMVGVNYKDILPYQIIGPKGVVFPDDDISVPKDGGLTLTLTVLSNYLKTVKADTYKDTLSFVIK